MAWPDDPAATNDTISATQLNRVPTRIMEHLAVEDVLALRLENIPQQFRHLRVVAMMRSDHEGATTTAAQLRINDETGSVYYRQYLAVNTTTAASSEALGSTSASVGYFTAADADAAYWSVVDLLFFDYAGAFRKCWLSSSNHFTGDAAGHAGEWSGFASITDPIDTITLTPNDTSNVVAGSRMTLYGIP